MARKKTNIEPEAASTYSEAKDFEFVQQDASIHDQKFSTKPTTYFKDAMKRFVKNRSSVVAGCILFVLIAMAIIVPVANKNDITTPSATQSYLPPKWFDGDLNGFFDGTGRVENVVLDQFDNLPADSNYESYAIIGEIDKSESYSSTWTTAVKNYGKNGALRIGNGSENDEAGNFNSAPSGIISPSVTISLSDESLSYKANFYEGASSQNSDEGHLYTYLGFAIPNPESGSTTDEPEVAIMAEGDESEDGEGEEEGESSAVISPDSVIMIPLTEPVEITDQVTLEATDIAATLSESEALAGHEGDALTGRFAIVISAPEEVVDTANSIYVESIETASSAGALSSISWSDATAAYGAMDAVSSGSYSRYGDATSLGIYRSEVTYGSFRYDYYAAAFGDVSGIEFTRNDIAGYIRNGWIEEISATEDNGTTTVFYKNDGSMDAPVWPTVRKTYNSVNLILTGEGDTYCPLRNIQTIKAQPNLMDPNNPTVTIQISGTQSLYRQLYFAGTIGSCKMPKYFFGTDRNGKDFFKVVFSGLLTSLGLGLLSSAINILIGLIWGAISGYFGGWTDLLMERFCEILGGMPFIVMMTLIVLLMGSSFWTFLLALCLTGWIGVAAETRRQFYRYKGREYVLASRTLGASDARLIFKHILPNGIGPIITSSVLMIPSVIFSEANVAYLMPTLLSFGGAQSFGITLSNVQGDLTLYPYLIVSASIVMALIMICFNLFGNGLRDAFNPALKGADE
ncbi:MAG: ABC transporter permease [Firmicutes bacterium]|uniref:ABC transporter permease n=1 Tax=Candidatus Alloenteromonas pullistercoris TaxID=2840785 RepID=A0A9D9DIU5_9FIRM|nr:ABC transporter permease [Candidatus Enteromonas pullistercoris]